MSAGARPVRAPRGTTLTAQGWPQEAALRMLMNNLDPEVAERPDDLVVYGGTGKAARNWEAFDALVRTLRTLKADETMLVQSGKPVGVMRTHEWAPRVLIANSNLVPDWATWPEFRRLEHLGLTMYGQMTAGSWIYIGTQGIVQGTYETFAAIAAKRYGGTLAGTLTVTGGCGGMGGAQPLAVTMNEGAVLVVEVDPARLQRRVDQRYLDEWTDDLDDAVARVEAAKRERRALSVGLQGNCAAVLPELLRRGVEVDIVTDQTSAHDPLYYLPLGVTLEEWHEYAERDPEGFTKRARESMARHVEAMVGFMDAGAEVFDYGNSIRAEAELGGYDRAWAFPGFVPAYIRPLFCEGKGPFRWAALSGDPADIHATDKAVLDLFPDNEPLHRWISQASEKIAFQGLPARICWLGQGERDRAGVLFNEMVADGRISAPIVIGRDHLDCGSVASPYRETEAMLDGSDAIADWPLLNALVNTASGATWVSIHHGGGVGIGRSIHAGQVSVADGTALAAEKLSRVLTNDPAMGVIRHVDAGYEIAERTADERGVRIPMREGDPPVTSTLITNIAELVTCDASVGDGSPLGILRDAALVTDGGSVVWTGPAALAPAADRMLDAEGRCVVPGFVDSHTHLVFAGERSAEFSARMAGEPYTGGGIATTVAATRTASADSLRAGAAKRVAEMTALGTTTLEAKSGYGLTVADETRLLEVSGEFTDETTFLGAHVVPPEFVHDRGAYVELVSGEMLAACAPHARWIDVFCDQGAFDAEETRHILRAGIAAGLTPRLHGNQLAHGSGALIAAEIGAASVDHCNHLLDTDILALACAGVVTTLLPAADFCTRTPYPDARRLLEAGITVALATDCNPGTSYVTSMPLVVALAVRELGMTPAEALWSATAGGAAALRRTDVGCLALGARADLIVLDAPSYAHLAYRPGSNLVHAVFRRGMRTS